MFNLIKRAISYSFINLEIKAVWNAITVNSQACISSEVTVFPNKNSIPQML